MSWMGYTEIVKDLWIGSAPPLFVRPNWAHLVLCAQEYQPSGQAFPGLRVHHVPLDDSGAPMTELERELAIAASRQVALAVNSGSSVLVTCAQGRNRSGLVVALALVRLGWTPQGAIDLVRSKRQWALSNRDFERLVLSTRAVRRPSPSTQQRSWA